MKNKNIAILTDYGPEIGQGHLQRMLSLAKHLSTDNQIHFLIKHSPPWLPHFIKKNLISQLNEHHDIIIRDMRDSSKKEINELKIYGPVIAIDDEGEGIKIADYRLNLLPHFLHPLDIQFILNHFIYGYSFTESIMRKSDHIYDKDIDITIYLGIKADRMIINTLLSVFQENRTIVVLIGNESFIMKNGVKTKLSISSYSEILMRSNVLITYFGITLFEGILAGCNIITINPTEYHSKLASYIQKELPLANLGIVKSLNMQNVFYTIDNGIQNPRVHTIKSIDIINTIEKNLKTITIIFEQSLIKNI